MPRNKVVPLEEAIARVESGMTPAIGGVLGQGASRALIRAPRDSGVDDLGGFLTPTRVGPPVAEGRQLVSVDGRVPGRASQCRWEPDFERVSAA